MISIKTSKNDWKKDNWNNESFINGVNDFYVKLWIPIKNNNYNSEEQARRLFEQYYWNQQSIQYSSSSAQFKYTPIY